MKENQLQSALAELLGSFILVFFGCGAVIINQTHDNIFGILGIALAFGMVVMAVVFAFGHVSGAHINPAVTIALAVVKKFSWQRVPAYILAQVVGTTIAALALKYSIANGSNALGLTLPSVSVFEAFVIEVILTAFLLVVIMGAGMDERANHKFAPLAVAGVIVVDVLVGGMLTGASMNPARSIGPALVAMNFEHLWLYIFAPIVGAIIGAWSYKFCTYHGYKSV